MKTKSAVLTKVEQLLTMKYHGRTVQNYLYHISLFLDFSKNVPDRITNEDFLDYNIYLANSDYSYPYRNVAINAVKAYFNLYLRKKVKGYAAIRPPKQKKVPKDIPHKFLMNKIGRITNTKAKAILLLGYGCGLRSNEVINLKVTDVNIEQEEILVRGKGNKERIVPMSTETALLIISYVDEHNPQEYLFNGQIKARYSPSSIIKLVKKHIGNYTFHQLRHSFATRLLRNGVGIEKVSALLGHSKLQTTMIYNHVMTREIERELLPV